MNIDKYPVKREGNEQNPKLVLLMCNPGGPAEIPTLHAEYAMDKDGLYHDAGMKISDLNLYCEWWWKLLKKITGPNLAPDDILSLEYYPYHSPDGSTIPPQSKWNEYALRSNRENIELIKRAIANGAVIYGFYMSNGWNTMPDVKQMLAGYNKYYSCKHQGPSAKANHLASVLRANGL